METKKLTLLTSWLPRPVDRHLDGLAVAGYLDRICGDRDGQGEGLAASRPTHKPQIIELGHLVLHGGGAVPQLAAVVLIISALDRHQCAVRDIVQSDHLEGARQ